LLEFQAGQNKHPSANRLASGRQNVDTTFSIQAYMIKADGQNVYCGLGVANFTTVKPVVAGMTNKSFGASSNSKVCLYRLTLVRHLCSTCTYVEQS
jgi:hypothetical protein